MSGKPLTHKQVSEIEDAFRQGHGVMRVAKAFKINHETAKRIRDGEHCLQRGPVVTKRCPDCGHVVKMPCHICEVRFYQEVKRDHPHLVAAYF